MFPLSALFWVRVMYETKYFLPLIKHVECLSSKVGDGILYRCGTDVSTGQQKKADFASNRHGGGGENRFVSVVL